MPSLSPRSNIWKAAGQRGQFIDHDSPGEWVLSNVLDNIEVATAGQTLSSGNASTVLGDVTDIGLQVIQTTGSVGESRVEVIYEPDVDSHNIPEDGFVQDQQYLPEVGSAAQGAIISKD